MISGRLYTCSVNKGHYAGSNGSVSPCLMTIPPELVTNAPTCGGTTRTTTYRKEYQVDSPRQSRHRPSQRQPYLSLNPHHNYAGHPWQPEKGLQMSTSGDIGQDDHGDHLTLLTTPTHKSNQRRGLWHNTSATLPTNFSATTEEHSDHCFPRPLSLRPEAHNHSNTTVTNVIWAFMTLRRTGWSTKPP